MAAAEALVRCVAHQVADGLDGLLLSGLLVPWNETCLLPIGNVTRSNARACFLVSPSDCALRLLKKRDAPCPPLVLKAGNIPLVVGLLQLATSKLSIVRDTQYSIFIERTPSTL